MAEEKSALELVEEFIQENDIILQVEPPRYQVTDDGYYLLRQPKILVNFREDVERYVEQQEGALDGN